jgi:SAM-dependent methyltransferase
MKSLLLCPKCMRVDLRLGSNLSLICDKCQINFSQNAHTRFYDFRSEVPSQDKGLLVEQETDFYSNNLFMQFVRANSQKKYRKVIEFLNPKVILDIGCGNGLFSENLKGIFSSYIGYEPSDLSIVKSQPFPPSDNTFLFHGDVDKKLPLREQSVDIVLFMASYDHIPQPERIIQDAWEKLKPDGYLMIVMSNYAFWVKSILNLFGGGQFFKHDHEHYCVHSPESLRDEILSFIPGAHLDMIHADDLYIPNLPKRISFFYFNYWWLIVLNKALRFFFTSILGINHRGSTMVLVFKKKDDCNFMNRDMV